ncbi:esterase-like activity of phytase family protein [Aureibaculum marinum]|uniref:Esterase-like activity of phytase family protein n=1 Tax=Aureibaculum marinum TaxID=2487930 RepID=A0A3N4NWL9_9FLAO|nr:esterase-like activity of phytase family protein [Aureibaculum marinum]RPD95979.1 esterase-like activity of phytase family protein [Aureibaculum marinum]
MKNIIILVLFLVTILSCKTLKGTSQDKLQLKYLDEYIIPENILVDETLVGGLSGIDYANNTYYLICDDAKNPRYYKAEIKINKSKIDTILFTSVVKFNDSSHYLDVEAIRFDVKRNNVLITSEGSINYKKDPSFFSVNQQGIIDHFYDIPTSLKATSKQKPRNNGTLEGLTISNDKKGYWIAMELPLEADGPEPKVVETKSPIRITNIDAATQKPTKQFAYLLDKIDKIPKENFAVNGLSDLLEYDKDKFIVIERSYSSGLGLQGNTIKLFDVDATNASNTLSMDGLIDTDFEPAHKELLFDFESVRSQLSNQVIDNIEGLTFGPTLSNGNRTLLLVADNNFNKLGQQFNQFILLEILDYK